MVPLHTIPTATLAPPLIEVLGSWEPRPVVVAVLIGAASMYARGWIRLRRRHPAGATPGALALCITGPVALAVVSPLDVFAGRVLAMHVVQHELRA